MRRNDDEKRVKTTRRSRERRRARLEIVVASPAGIRAVCARFHHCYGDATAILAQLIKPLEPLDRSSIPRMNLGAYLEGCVLGSNLRETDYVAEVDRHRLVVLSWYLMQGKLINLKYT